MASAKSSRSRPAGHSGVFPVGSAAAVGSGGGGGSDGGVQLADKLKIFKTDNFDPDAYVQSKCQTMNEKVSPASLSACRPAISDPAALRGPARRLLSSCCACCQVRVCWTAGVVERSHFVVAWWGVCWTRRM